MALTEREKLFVASYIKDPNATQAAILAGFSVRSAATLGNRLLRKVEVAKAISEGLAARRTEFKVESDEILRELLNIARFDVATLYTDGGHPKALKEIEPSARRCIVGLEMDELYDGNGEDRVQTGYTRKLKLADKMRALELLGKHLQLWTDKVKIEGKLTLADLVAGTTGGDDNGRREED